MPEQVDLRHRTSLRLYRGKRGLHMVRDEPHGSTCATRVAPPALHVLPERLHAGLASRDLEGAVLPALELIDQPTFDTFRNNETAAQ